MTYSERKLDAFGKIFIHEEQKNGTKTNQRIPKFGEKPDAQVYYVLIRRKCMVEQGQILLFKLLHKKSKDMLDQTLWDPDLVFTHSKHIEK